MTVELKVCPACKAQVVSLALHNFACPVVMESLVAEGLMTADDAAESTAAIEAEQENIRRMLMRENEK